MFCKRGVLRNFVKFAGKNLCRSLFFPVNFAKFLRTSFFTEHLRWLLQTFTCWRFFWNYWSCLNLDLNKTERNSTYTMIEIRHSNDANLFYRFFCRNFRLELFDTITIPLFDSFLVNILDNVKLFFPESTILVTIFWMFSTFQKRFNLP